MRHSGEEGGRGGDPFFLEWRRSPAGVAAAGGASGQARCRRLCCAKNRVEGQEGACGQGKPGRTQRSGSDLLPSPKSEKYGGGRGGLRRGNTLAWGHDSKGRERGNDEGARDFKSEETVSDLGIKTPGIDLERKSNARSVSGGNHVDVIIFSFSFSIFCFLL